MKAISYSILLIFIIMAWGCKNFLEIPAPQEQTPTEKVFQLDESANEAGLGLYQNTEALIYNITLFAGYSGDELVNHSNSTEFQMLFKNSLNSTESVTHAVWDKGFNQIYNANAIYEGCINSAVLSSPVKDQCIGEALFFRALWHFYLVNLYGEIPIVTSTNYLVNAKATKAPKMEVYKQIMLDLKQAQLRLKVDYSGANPLSNVADRTRVNRYAALGLMSRIALYAVDYVEAEKSATAVITAKNTYDTVALNNVFLKNNKEAILQLMASRSVVNTMFGDNFILTLSPVTQSIANCSSFSNYLLDAFEVGDKRKVNWIAKFNTGGVDYYFPYKYKIRGGSAHEENATILRLGEQYLIRAEARAQMGDLAGAIADIDVIRKRAGLPLISETNGNISKDNLINVILKERMLELFSEFGDRWMDLIRTGKIDAVMTTVGPIKGGQWASYKQLWPIPIKDVENNPNMIQNTGYK